MPNTCGWRNLLDIYVLPEYKKTLRFISIQKNILKCTFDGKLWKVLLNKTFCESVRRKFVIKSSSFGYFEVEE